MWILPYFKVYSLLKGFWRPQAVVAVCSLGESKESWMFVREFLPLWDVIRKS